MYYVAVNRRYLMMVWEGHTNAHVQTCAPTKLRNSRNSLISSAYKQLNYKYDTLKDP